MLFTFLVHLIMLSQLHRSYRMECDDVDTIGKDVEGSDRCLS
jgi:hypothetical protein